METPAAAGFRACTGAGAASFSPRLYIVSLPGFVSDRGICLFRADLRKRSILRNSSGRVCSASHKECPEEMQALGGEVEEVGGEGGEGGEEGEGMDNIFSL